MLAYTYIEHGKFGLLEKPIPVLEDAYSTKEYTQEEIY